MKKFFMSMFITIIIIYTLTALAETQATKIIHYNPFNKPNLKIIKTVQGYCWTTSLRTNQPNAWRCMAGNAIHDPCFVNPANKT